MAWRMSLIKLQKIPFGGTVRLISVLFQKSPSKILIRNNSQSNQQCYPTIKPTTVRVCTPEDLKKRVCPSPPKPCPKKPKIRELTSKERLKILIVRLIKLSIVGALLYYTTEEGLWGSQKESLGFWESHVCFLEKMTGQDAPWKNFDSRSLNRNIWIKRGLKYLSEKSGGREC